MKKTRFVSTISMGPEVCIYVYMDTWIDGYGVCVFMCIYVREFMCIYVYIHTWIEGYDVCMYVCVCVCVCIDVCVCVDG